MAVECVDKSVEFHLGSLTQVFTVVIYVLYGLLNIQHGVRKQELLTGNRIHLLGGTACRIGTGSRLMHSGSSGRHFLCVGTGMLCLCRLFGFCLFFEHLLDRFRHLSGFRDAGRVSVSHLRLLALFGFFRHFRHHHGHHPVHLRLGCFLDHAGFGYSFGRDAELCQQRRISSQRRVIHHTLDGLLCLGAVVIVKESLVLDLFPGGFLLHFVEVGEAESDRLSTHQFHGRGDFVFFIRDT